MNAKLKLIAWDPETCGNKKTWTTLGDPIMTGLYSDRYQIRTGEYLLGIWYQPRARRWVVKRGSVWEDRSNPGHTIGDTYEECTAMDVREIIENLGLEVELESVMQDIQKFHS